MGEWEKTERQTKGEKKEAKHLRTYKKKEILRKVREDGKEGRMKKGRDM
jgi:hypothetical protein